MIKIDRFVFQLLQSIFISIDRKIDVLIFRTRRVRRKFFFVEVWRPAFQEYARRQNFEIVHLFITIQLFGELCRYFSINVRQYLKFSYTYDKKSNVKQQFKCCPTQLYNTFIESNSFTPFIDLDRSLNTKANYLYFS